MELWIPVTLAAAFLQNVRSAMQKHLKKVMGTTGATFVRFGFGVPFALFFVGVLNLAAGYPFPALNAGFARLVGGVSQITATFLLIHLFHRNFAVGTAYSRTEPAQAALFGLLFLGESVYGRHRRDRDLRVRRHADLGRARGVHLADAAHLGVRQERADRPGIRDGLRRLGGRLPCRLAVARRTERADAGGGDSGGRHRVPDRADVGLDGLARQVGDRADRPRLEAVAGRRPGRGQRFLRLVLRHDAAAGRWW